MEILVIKTRKYGLAIFSHDRLNHIYILDKGIKVCISTDGYTGGGWLEFTGDGFELMCRKWHRKRLLLLQETLEGTLIVGPPREILRYGNRPAYASSKPGDPVPDITTIKVRLFVPKGDG